MADWYWYEKTGDGAVRLLRVFGTSPEAVIPQKLAGGTVTSLGAYCFAAGRQPSAYEICSAALTGEEAAEEFERLLSGNHIVEISGKYLEKVVLSETVTSIGNYCFYQCRGLKELVFGKALTEIGSDAFMNCHALHRFTVLGSVAEPNGLKQILGQRSLETEVDFVLNGRIETVLVYPEYSETYDEIGPAHIFELSIEGEGFRARQCFQNGIVDIPKYDAVFLQACAVEGFETLCRMAWMRLYYPTALRQEYKECYGDFLKRHSGAAGRLLVQERALGLLEFLAEDGYLTKEAVGECIQAAAATGWTEGAGMLLRCQERMMAGKKQDAYLFEDF